MNKNRVCLAGCRDQSGWLLLLLATVFAHAPARAESRDDCGCVDGSCLITDTATLESCAAGNKLANKVVYLEGKFTPTTHLVVAEGSEWRATHWGYDDSGDVCSLESAATIDGSLLPDAPGEIFGRGIVTLSNGAALSGLRITNVDPYNSTNPCLDVIGDASVTDVHTTSCSIGQRYMTPRSGQQASFRIHHSCVSDSIITGIIVATGDIRITEGVVDPISGMFEPAEHTKANISISNSRIVDGLFNLLVFGGLGSSGAETHASLESTQMLESKFAAIRVVGGQDNMLDPYPGDHGAKVTLQIGKDNVISGGIVGLQIEGGTFGGVPMVSMDTSTDNQATVILDESTIFGEYAFDAALIGSAGNLVDQSSGELVFGGERNRITLSGKAPDGFTVDVVDCSPISYGCPTSNEIDCKVDGCP